MTDMPGQSLSQVAGQRQIQEQTLTPLQLQSLKILAAPLQELDQRVNAALSENPMLEESEPEPDPESSEERSGGELGSEHGDLEDELGRVVDLAASGAVDADDHYFDTPYSDDDEERREYMFNSIVSEVSMQENLMTQLRLSGVKDPLFRIAENVIGSIDESGYLRTPLADIAMTENCTVAEAEEALKLVQTFDPPGIGARDYKECLLLQLEVEDPDFELMRTLISDHLSELAANHYPQTAKALGITIDRLNELVAKLKCLKVAPGAMISQRPVQYIIPEAEVVPDGEEWKVIMNDEAMPHLVISKKYLKMLEDPATAPDVKAYLKAKYMDGNGFLKALENRRSTIARITDMIVSAQYDFFREGVQALKPMTMQQIADKLDVHETTVSRALANKYLKTPQGLFEYKYFFTSGFRTENGDTISSRGIKEILKDMISQEDPENPLSDNTLMEMLVKQGMNVKRRTVAKYREELGIKSSHLRRKFK